MITGKGQSIEDKSMKIIEREIGSHSYLPDEWTIVKRVIHSTADFDFARENKIIFHMDAIKKGVEALKSGCAIVVDVNGVVGGFNKDNLKKFGNQVICNISESSVVNKAKALNKTRAQTSMRVASKDMNRGIVAIGNAPTALLEVIQMIKEGLTLPSLVIGIPVGFVCASESKDELRTLDIPYITNLGRKGGSPCASAIVNGLYIILKEKLSS
ncbi:MAG: precorrin-8X methylmutase [Thaumarchaeota archaeon 13_1_40CM_3_38_6]|nr:MAG: precorrin-8X methylmutase [Thaumarchaeota archaeon 13_1_40CM_3_38_6]OLD21913.1 MAG: precorrin-8X methylmutase [Thaumarchaeota archaeon 13_1_40CM_2_39_13_1]OLE44829.1 MAG: precorrin-8X methylmutase [Thaumarchaeota archaeon 13_1_20CM_2_39_11]